MSLPAPVRTAAYEVPDPPPLPNSSKLSIQAKALSWVTACADGKKLFERALQPGEVVAIPYSETAIVRSGNAGGLEVVFGDQSLGVMGQVGAVRMLRATPQGFEYVPASLSDSCVPETRASL